MILHFIGLILAFYIALKIVQYIILPLFMVVLGYIFISMEIFGGFLQKISK